MSSRVLINTYNCSIATMRDGISKTKNRAPITCLVASDRRLNLSPYSPVARKRKHRPSLTRLRKIVINNLYPVILVLRKKKKKKKILRA